MKAGRVDGITRRAEATVDALPLEAHVGMVELLTFDGESVIPRRTILMTQTIEHPRARHLSRAPSEVGRPLRARARRHSRRHHARQPSPRAVPDLRGSRPGLAQVGRGRPRVRRLLDGSRLRSSSATAIPRWSRRSRSRRRAARISGACHELEVRWAELVSKLVPSAEMVRFTMSGTEATHLALRIARAYTGHPKVVKLHGHFHGWHDGVVAAVNPPFDVPMSAGVPTADPRPAPSVPAQRHQGGGGLARARRRRGGDSRARGWAVGHHADHPRLSCKSCATLTDAQ